MQIIYCLSFLTIVTSICLLQNEQQGQCTSCSPLDFLDAGRCYTKIRGCLTNKAGPICIECQSGYILNATICIRQAVFLNETNSTIPPVTTNNTPTLTPGEIQAQAGQYSQQYTQTKSYFVNKYPVLNGAQVKNISVLKTKTSVFLSIEFRTNNSNVFTAVGFFNVSNNFKQWSFTNGTVRNDPFVADAFVRQVFKNDLANFTVYSLNITNVVYTIDYINNSTDILRATVNRNQLLSNFSANVQLQPLTISDLALQFAVKLYPSLLSASISSVRKYESLYLVQLGLGLAMSYEFDNVTFKINRPTTGVIGAYNLGTINESAGLPDFINYTDSRFVAAVEKASQQLPELIGAQVTKVKYQVVTGIIFFLSINKNGTIYQIKIWSPLTSPPQILQANRNNIPILSASYSYNQDYIFMANYITIPQQSKVLNIPSINSVYFKLNGNIRYYKVIYSDKEYAQLMVSSNGTSWLGGYFIDGKDIRESIGGNTSEKRSVQVLMALLEVQQPFTMGSKVEQFSQASSLYTLTIVTKSGKYKATIQDNGTLNLTSFVLLSNATCYSYKLAQLAQDPKLSQIAGFLTANYPLTGFTLQLLQTKVTDISSYQHRFLYASGNGTGKQVQIVVEQKNSTASILKAAYLNFNFEPSVSSSSDYTSATSLIGSLNLKGTQVPLFVEANTTHIRTYYNDGKSTLQIVYKKGSSDVKSNIVAIRQELVLPDGFDFAFLLLPGNSTTEIDRVLGLIVAQAVKKYSVFVKDAAIVFAEKRNQTYSLLVKNTYGFTKIEANVSSKGVITLNRVIITSYKATDFGTCTKFTKSGQCSSCSVSESEYQGGCYHKIEGCLKQAGSFCVKCEGSYVRSGPNCFRQCTNFFK